MRCSAGRLGLQRAGDPGPIAFIHRTTDGAADRGTDQGPNDRCGDPAASLADLRTERAAQDAADDAAGLLLRRRRGASDEDEAKADNRKMTDFFAHFKTPSFNDKPGSGGCNRPAPAGNLAGGTLCATASQRQGFGIVLLADTARFAPQSKPSKPAFAATDLRQSKRISFAKRMRRTYAWYRTDRRPAPPYSLHQHIHKSFNPQDHTQEKIMLKKILASFMLLGFLASVTGCNTIAGAGKDIERGGEKVQDTAKDTQKKM